MARVLFPQQLSHLTGNCSRVDIDSDSLAELLEKMCSSYPRLTAVLFDSERRVSPFIGLFINGEQLATTELHTVKLVSKSEIQIVAAVAGG